MTEASRNNASFVRWQGRLLQQFGAVNNLLIGLAAGIVAFELPLFFNSPHLSVFERHSLLISFIALVLSASVGCWTAWNRLIDFRKTTATTRSADTQEKSDLRKETELLGKKSWCLIRFQAFLFALGMVALLPAVVCRLL